MEWEKEVSVSKQSIYGYQSYKYMSLLQWKKIILTSNSAQNCWNKRSLSDITMHTWLAAYESSDVVSKELVKTSIHDFVVVSLQD
jgi:hypothetical protein